MVRLIIAFFLSGMVLGNTNNNNIVKCFLTLLHGFFLASLGGVIENGLGVAESPWIFSK